MEEQLRERCEALRQEVKERESHKNPMYYHALMNYSWSKIACALLSGQQPEQSDVDYVCGVKKVRSTTTPGTSLPKDVAKAIEDGSIVNIRVMDILDKYRESVPNIHNLLSKALVDNGYAVKGFNIVKQVK